MSVAALRSMLLKTAAGRKTKANLESALQQLSTAETALSSTADRITDETLRNEVLQCVDDMKRAHAVFACEAIPLKS